MTEPTPLRSVADLTALRERLAAESSRFSKRILICSTGCRALGAAELGEVFRQKVAEAQLGGQVAVVETGCHGLCAMAPVVVIEPQDITYGGVEVKDIDEIVERTVRKGEVIERLCYEKNAKLATLSSIPFYKNQLKQVLRRCGRIDPRSFEQAIARGAYTAAAKALFDMTPEQIIEEVSASGLRGRGGAGFPTGTKWKFCRQSPGEDKYLICNADEGDPGAFMDRALLEGDPHAVLEGMIIAARAIGANHGFVYVRAEYPIAVEHVNRAVADARQYGLLGQNILGSDMTFDIEVREGAGAFVCGEETALIASLEGRRGMPRPRPPFPALSGYDANPTDINNVETLGNVPLIIEKGAAEYASRGTEKSKGTKIFALAGKVKNTGLVEVPMGTTLRQIVEDVGGGVPQGRTFKAAQTGGPSGGCVPAQYLDMPIDYESLREVGAIMGSGGLIVMDDRTCMVDIARYFLSFVQKESCGKCSPCRVGTRKMLEILDRICEGQGRIDDIDELERIARTVLRSSMCGLGQTAPNPVLSTIRYFRDEYEEHILLGHCRASTCKGLVSAPCAHACPAGVNVPEYVSLIGEGRFADAVNLVRRRNPFVSICGRVCDHPCERRCRRSDVDEPLAIKALKRFAADQMQDFTAPIAPPAAGKAQVAIVGAGPAGLSCAYFLALMGRPSVVFEAQPIPGGMLALGIPEYRLPKRILEQEIAFILAHGVKLETGKRVEDIEGLLKAGYRAVFLAAGAQKGRRLNVPGEELRGVVDSLDFLRQRGLGRPLPCGKSVAVIGGGNAAVDAARSAIRLGAEKVMILYRRSRKEMPAYEEEIDAALKEGVELNTHVIPKRIVGQDGRVSGIEVIRVRLGTADASGRQRPIPIEGSEFVVDCDMVLPAVGQAASLEAMKSHAAETLDGSRRLKTDPITQATNLKGVFGGGDCVTGGGTVIEAIQAGQRAACGIDRYLGGKGVLPPDTGLTFRAPTDQDAEVRPRAAERELPIEARQCSFDEVMLGLDAAEAMAEAHRCLRCDLERLKEKGGLKKATTGGTARP